jgi:hypothetical protein
MCVCRVPCTTARLRHPAQPRPDPATGPSARSGRRACVGHELAVLRLRARVGQAGSAVPVLQRCAAATPTTRTAATAQTSARSLVGRTTAATSPAAIYTPTSGSRAVPAASASGEGGRATARHTHGPTNLELVTACKAQDLVKCQWPAGLQGLSGEVGGGPRGRRQRAGAAPGTVGCARALSLAAPL